MLRKREKEHKPEKGREDKVCLFLTLIFFLINFSTALAIDSISTLDELEEKIFHHKFKNEEVNQRINRLEEFTFGETHAGLNTEKRIENITSALKPEQITDQNQEDKTRLPEALKPPTTTEAKSTPKVIYDEAFNVGIVGTVSQMEVRVFGQPFNNLPFEKRIKNLEEKVLSIPEINKNKKKPLIERITYLVQRINLIPQAQNQIPPYQGYTPQSYTIDPDTGYLINEETKEIIKDISGNPVYVKIPPQLFKQNIEEDITRELIPPEYQLPNQFPYGTQEGIYKQNFPPYGKYQQPTNKIPPELFFNPNSLDIGGEEGY